MAKFRVVVASTRRKLKTFLEKSETFHGSLEDVAREMAKPSTTLADAKKFADDYKLEHGVNCIVTEIRDVYTTTTLDEAVAEARAADEARARNSNAAA